MPKVTSNPPLKRTRPCDSCRKRKSKCVMEENSNTCVLCRFHKYECTFLNPAQKKRKVLKSIQKENNTDKPRFDSIIVHITPSPSADKSGESEQLSKRIRENSQSIGSESSNELTGSSPLSENIGELLYLSPQITKVNNSIMSYIGSSSEWDRSLIQIFKSCNLFSIQSHYLNQEGSIKCELEKVSGDKSFIKLAELTENHSEINADQVKKIEDIVGKSGPRLVLLYFRIVHPSFPILDKKLFMDQYETDITATPSCLLACLYLFALNWWSFDSDLSTEIKPSQVRLEEAAESAFSVELDFPTISTVQAGLLLIQHQNFKNQYGNKSHVWVMQSSILAVAQELGLDQDCSGWLISEREKSLRKRLAWALFIHEKWLSFSLGRTSHIRDENWPIQKLEECDFFEDDKNISSDIIGDFQDGIIDFEQGKLLFIEMVKLSTILSTVLKEIYGMKVEQLLKSLSREKVNEKLETLLNLIKPLQQKLNEWESRLPKCLLMEDIKRGQISGTPNLHTAIFSVKIGLFKPVLSYIVQIKTNEVEVNDAFLELLNLVLARAYSDFESALNFLSGMKAEHLQTFWYSFAKTSFAFTGTFGILIALASSKRDQFCSCLDRLAEYAWKLKVNSKNAEFLFFSRVWIEQLKKLLPAHLTMESFKPFRVHSKTLDYPNATCNPNETHCVDPPRNIFSSNDSMLQHLTSQSMNLENLLSGDCGLEW